MSCIRLTALLLTVFTTIACAEEPIRLWMSADGKRTFKGQFVERNRTSVTFSLEPSGSRATIPANKIHPEDIKWLDANHPLPELPKPKPRQQSNTSRNHGHGNSHRNGNSVLENAPVGPAVFDQIALGDSYDVVMRKLHKSKMVKATVPQQLIGRTGLNGIYQTRNALAGMQASLFFDWDDSNHLKELTLHTDGQAAANANTVIVDGWKRLITELTKLHGQPKLSNPKLDLRPIPDGGISFTHAWQLDQRGSALLGAARDGDQYQVTVRYTTEGF